MKKKLPTIILILVLLAGLSLLLYPTVSDYINSLHQTRAISDYVEAVENLDDDTYEHLWNNAVEYNKKLLHKNNRYKMTAEERADYESQLNVLGNGIMGYVDIPEIKCTLPIYHGTDEDVLQIAAGHIDISSLPVGGESTHCVISGHRGLPSARLFTDLDKMVEGDLFMLRVLDETLTYEVDQIRIVLPDELSSLEITQGKDYCTLVTCTPYGVNTHRLLVRGHRVENQEISKKAQVTADAMQVEPLLVATVIAVLILIILMIALIIKSKTRKNRK
ncbi:MAG: class C sortase [Eubacterium sp.]